MTFETIELEIDGYVALVRLNRPERANGVIPQMQVEMSRALAELRERGTRALILTGAGKTFCPGLDIGRLADRPEGGHELDEFEWAKRRLPAGSFALQFRDFPAPTIAAVNGVAAGMGLALTLACDVRIAGESGRFSAVWVRRGLAPDTGTSVMLPQAVGLSNALRMMCDGGIVGAQEALAMGLVSQVVPDGDLIAAARAMANRFAANPPLAVEMAKKLAYGNLLQSANSAAALELFHNMNTLGPSDDSREAIRSFVEKREGTFKGR